MLKAKLTTGVLFSLYFYTVTSIKLYRLDDLTDNPLLVKLKNFFDNERDKANSIKSRIVSRIVPHALKSQPYEYDSETDTLFKPLIRIYLKKPIHKYLDIFNKQDSSENIGNIAFIDKKHKEKRYEPVSSNKPKRSIKGNTFKREIFNLAKLLRHGLVDKTAEENDEFEPGKVPVKDSNDEKPKPTVKMPDYAYWNYWTYGKTIHEDDCKGNLVLLGDICISPHRR